MKGAAEKQRWLEPLIATVRRDPAANEHLVIFLMLVFEPVRRSVSKAFVAAHGGISAQPRDVSCTTVGTRPSPRCWMRGSR